MSSGEETTGSPSGDGVTPPITLKGRRLACENRRFHVWFDHIVDTVTGTEVPEFLVVAPHCRRDDLIAGVSIIPVVGDGIVMLRPYRHPVGCFGYELPRGFVDVGEEPATAALRELREETGLETTPGNLIPLGSCMPEPGIFRARIALFAAEGCRPVTEERDAEELGLGEAVTIPRAEVFAMLRAMTIEDVTTTVALHRYAVLSGATL